MLATKKRYFDWAKPWGTGLLLLAVLSGCAPSGPRSLLQGERLLHEGKYPQAIDKLRVAVQLLPKHAQAWNHLGLAYHYAGQASNAVVAYRRAMLLDPQLLAAHHNLGSLWLEHNNLPAAIDELRNYALHPRSAGSGEAWSRLGTALLRARRWEDAEKVLDYTVRQLGNRSPEVLNNLGVALAQRHRAADAATCFHLALSQQKNYESALLNLAVVYHQQPSHRHDALQRYREYLALEPKPAHWEEAAAVAKHLDQQLNTPILRPIQSNWQAQATAQTETRPPPPTDTPTRPAVTTVTPKAATPPSRPQVTPPAPPPRSAPPATPPAAEPPVAPPKPPKVEPVAAPPVETPISAPVEVASVPEALVIRPPQGQAPSVPLATPATPEPPRPAPVPSAADPALARIGKPAPPPPKRSFLDRLNPFGGRDKTEKPDTPPAVTPTQLPQASIPEAPPTPPPVPTLAPQTPPVTMPSFKRYDYISPPRPAPGNRPQAGRYFEEGLKRQEAGEPAQALAYYQKAAELDPAYFEALYNLGLSAAAAGDLKQALTTGERALAIKPDSAEARYNFAMALRQAGYVLDAANELQRVLRSQPADTKTHLSLGNLYAQRLNQPRLAREHYLKVIAAEPHHPQAAAIRYWLAANP